VWSTSVIDFKTNLTLANVIAIMKKMQEEVTSPKSPRGSPRGIPVNSFRELTLW
jgi:hypothetical protein